MAPNTNPPCPKCQGRTNKNGVTSAQLRRYRCTNCKHSFTPNSNGKPGPEKSGNAKSRAQIQADYRKRHRLTGNEARKRKANAKIKEQE